jgi:putative transposase
MPNHFHALVRPEEPGALSAYFHRVLGCYSRHLRTYTHTSGTGHVFQQRFWSGPIDDDRHFLSVLRYIERNALTAKLVKQAEDWPWSSLMLRQTGGLDLLDAMPVALPADWVALVNDEPLVEDPD